MKRLFLTLFVFAQVKAFSQTVYVNLYGGSLPMHNMFWNNWLLVNNTVNDTSGFFVDMLYNNSGMRGVLSAHVNSFDNGTSYAPCQTILPDTVLRTGSYTTGLRTLTIIGLDDSATYILSLYASRNRTDGQATIFTAGGFTQTITTDTNSFRVATFTGLASQQGKMVISMRAKTMYQYLNAFSIVGIPKYPPVATLLLDSTLIHSPNSVVHLDATGSYQINGKLVSYQWLQASGPSPAIFTPASGLSNRMVVSGLLPGTYRFQLYVSDSLGNSSSAFANVVVVPVPPCPPLRTAIPSLKMVGGQWQIVLTYSDGNP